MKILSIFNFKQLFISVIIFYFQKYTAAVNILVLESVPSPSHHIWIQTLTSELASRGHNITSLSADVDTNQIPNLHYLHLDQMYEVFYNSTEKPDYNQYYGHNTLWSLTLFYGKYVPLSCKGSLISKGVQQLLSYPNDFIFDLVLYDYVVHPCLLGFLHKFNYPPLLSLSAFGYVLKTNFIMGASFYSYIPGLSNDNSDTTFVNRVKNYIFYLIEMFVKEYYLHPKCNKMAAKYFPGAPKVSEMEKLTQLVLINFHPAVNIVEPILPGVIPVGGMQIKRAKELPNDLKLIADSAKNSLILFSLGTNMRADQIGHQKVKIFLEAFRGLPKYTFLWKIDLNSFSVSVPKNVHTRAWLPQVEILSHPNTILFISHAGILGFQESIWYGVPILGIPLFADQFVNIEMLKKFGVAEKIEFHNFNETKLQQEIEKMVNNATYRKNAQIRSKYFRDQHETPIERAVFWTEWLIKNKRAQDFKGPLAAYGTLERLQMDIIAFLLVILIFIIILVYNVMLILLHCVTKNRNRNIKID